MDQKVKVIWSHEATYDLSSIADYISQDSVFYAAGFVEKILDMTRSLAVFSKRGRVVPELGNPDIREIFVNDYLII